MKYFKFLCITQFTSTSVHDSIFPYFKWTYFVMLINVDFNLIKECRSIKSESVSDSEFVSKIISDFLNSYSEKNANFSSNYESNYLYIILDILKRFSHIESDIKKRIATIVLDEKLDIFIPFSYNISKIESSDFVISYTLNDSTHATLLKGFFSEAYPVELNEFIVSVNIGNPLEIEEIRLKPLIDLIAIIVKFEMQHSRIFKKKQSMFIIAEINRRLALLERD